MNWSKTSSSWAPDELSIKQLNKCSAMSENNEMKFVRSKELNEVVNYKAGFLEGGGLYLLGFLMAGLLAAASFFRYPDIDSVQGIVCADDGRYYAKIWLPQPKIGQVKAHAPVRLYLDAYPAAQYGYLDGKIGYISPVVTDTGCLAIIYLDQGSRTNLHQEVAFKIGLTLNASLSLGEKSLLERWYHSVTGTMHVDSRKSKN